MEQQSSSLKKTLDTSSRNQSKTMEKKSQQNVDSQIDSTLQEDLSPTAILTSPFSNSTNTITTSHSEKSSENVPMSDSSTNAKKSSLESTIVNENETICNESLNSSNAAFDDSGWKLTLESPQENDISRKSFDLDATTEKDIPSNVSMGNLSMEDSASDQMNNNTNSNNHNKEYERNIDTDKVNWSISLRTPRKGYYFSPSKDIKSTNFHGLGISLTMNRAKQITKSQTRISKFLFHIANLNENFGSSILKISQTHSSSISSSPSAMAISALLTDLLSSLSSFGQEIQNSAMDLKTLSRPLHTHSLKMLEPFRSNSEEYGACRDICAKARRAAMKQKKLYVRSVKEADYALKELEKAKLKSSQNLDIQDVATEELEEDVNVIMNANVNVAVNVTANANANANASVNGIGNGKQSKTSKSQKLLLRKSERTLQALRVVQNTEKDYTTLVQNENNAVIDADQSESIFLEKLQTCEEHRLNMIWDTYLQWMQNEIQTLDGMTITFRPPKSPLKQQRRTTTAPTTPSMPSPTTLFTKLLNFTDDSGVSEAISLGLPKEVGEVRDQIKAALDAQGHYAMACHIVSNVMSELANHVEEYGHALKLRLHQEGYASPSSIRQDSISIFLPQVEGRNTLHCWNEMIESWTQCIQSAMDLSQKLLSSNQIQKELEKHVKVTTDTEEQSWRQLCETARIELKTKQRKDSAYQELVKAKERLNYCIEHPEGNEEDVSEKVNLAMRKALGNMSSILPNKGEYFTKMLHPQNAQTKQALAVKVCDEAEIKYQKEMEVYKSIQKDLEMLITSYMATSKGSIKSLKKKEEIVRSQIENHIDGTLDCLQNYRVERYTNLKPAAVRLKEERNSGVVKDMKDWSYTVRDKYSLHLEKLVEDGKVPPEQEEMKDKFDLSSLCISVERVDSPRVYSLISLLEKDANNGKELDVPDKDCLETDDPEDKIENTLPDNSSSSNLVDLQRSTHSTKSDILNTSESIILTENEDANPSKPQSTVEISSLALLLKGAIEQERKSLEEAQAGDVSLPVSRATSAETEIFLQHFQKGDSEDPPTLIGSYSCAYHPKEDSGSPYYLLHGRMFATPDSMYFVGWGETKVIVPWKDIVSVKKEANVMGVVNNSLRIIANHGGGEKSYYFGSFAFREHCYQTVNKLVAVSKSIKELSGQEDSKPTKSKDDTNEKKKAQETEGEKVSLPPAPPDEILKKMKIVFQEKLVNVSVQKFYDLCIAETLDPFYGPFLERQGNAYLKISDWEIDGPGLTNGWCGEKFTKKRVSLITNIFSRFSCSNFKYLIQFFLFRFR